MATAGNENITKKANFLSIANINFIHVVPSHLICQMLVSFLELNPKGLYTSAKKKIET